MKLYLCINTLICLLMLSGCQRMQMVKPLELLTTQHAQAEETHNNITVRVKELNETECVALFGSNGTGLFGGKQPLHPLQLCIENKSASSWVLAENGISLKLETEKKIHKKIHSSWGIVIIVTSTIIGVTALATAAAFPFIFALTAFCAGWWSIPSSVAFGIMGTGIAVGGGIGVAAPVAGGIIGSQELDKNKTSADLVHEAYAVLPATIEPNTIYNKIMFVRKKEYKKTFDIELVDITTKQRPVFTIRLGKKTVT